MRDIGFFLWVKCDKEQKIGAKKSNNLKINCFDLLCRLNSKIWGGQNRAKVP